MKYIDITLKVPSPNTASEVARNIHATITNVGKPYAMAMPRKKNEPYAFNIIRLFALDDEAILDFLKVFNKNSDIKIGDTVDVPDDYDGDIVQYKYFSVQKPRKNTNNFDVYMQSFLQRSAFAESLYYFKYKHRNRSGKLNPKHFEELLTVGKLTEFNPNNYGFASANRQVWLPNFYL